MAVRSARASAGASSGKSDRSTHADAVHVAVAVSYVVHSKTRRVAMDYFAVAGVIGSSRRKPSESSLNLLVPNEPRPNL